MNIKKVIFIIIIIILVGCNNKTNNTSNVNESIENKNATSNDKTLEEQQPTNDKLEKTREEQQSVNDNIEEKPKEQSKQIIDNKIDKSLEEKSQKQENEGIQYINNSMGFSIIFPNSWEGYYNIVKDENSGCIDILYTGKDSTIKGEDGNGLYMFSIIREDKLDDFLDSIKEIGTYREQKYYYATHTDFEIGSLRDEEDENMNTDFKKAMSMLEDVPEILKTIKSIEQQSADDKIEEDSQEQPRQQDEGIKYVNDVMGFSLTFPNSWEGYYNIVEEENGGYIDILYTGKDSTIKGEDGNGLYMFSIIREDELDDFLDSIKEIGTYREQKYYYATHTDFEIGSLRDEEDENMNTDFKKAMSMLEDVPQILETISAME
ncbi:hypothetical protein SH1V18_26770 [Vallitalea longa]|uniref:Lipoprotein n=1 Tax=Vallitalea longa TaxID=2936439 RepID=A0A9W6DG55_9FIRM|nr:hypothetical protein [Vallitalea longa]GKX30197.1 hypothetical protein SH1V18_26770 [Vallitalea longa]